MTIDVANSCFTRRLMSSEASSLSMTASTAGHVTPGRPADGRTTLATYLNGILESEIRDALLTTTSSKTSVRPVPAVDVRDSGGNRSTDYKILGSSHGGRCTGDRPSSQTSSKQLGENKDVQQVRAPLGGATEWFNSTSNNNNNNNYNYNNQTKNDVIRASNVLLQVERYSNGHQVIGNGYNHKPTGLDTSQGIRKSAPAPDVRSVRAVQVSQVN